jgi:hypothetical protein
VVRDAAQLVAPLEMIVHQLSQQQKEMKMKAGLSIVMTLTLASCAASPSSIQPAAVSRIPYTTMPCENLRMQIDQEISNLETLSGEQIASRNWDIALNLILIPGVGALTGDQEEAIAQSKGKMVVMQDEYAKRCSQG